MIDWIDHRGRPPQMGDETWVEIVDPIEGVYQDMAISADWTHATHYHILNQHLIDAARLEGIRLGLEAAATTVCRAEIKAARELEESGDSHCPAEGRFAGLAEATDLIRALNPETIASQAD